jgi:aminopeptidase N
MELDGRSDMKLDSIEINGEAVDASNYELTPQKLVLKACPPGEFELKITTTIKPQENTLLEGLYKSGGNFCTQVLCPELQIPACAC